jgi:hypothetical protein
MRWTGTASFAGLCLLASCAYAQPAPSRGQYSVSFKIVGGKLAVDHDAFQVPQSFVKFEPAIRLTVRQAIEKIEPLSTGLLIDCAWTDYIAVYEAWSAMDPNRLDLGALFSSDFLFSNLLQQTPDSGLILNDELIDPLNGSVSFSILPLFDSNSVGVELPAMIQSRRGTRIPQLRKRLAKLNGSLWSSTDVRNDIALI